MVHSKTSSPFQPTGDNDLYCKDLPSTPRPTKGKVLVTGASGYIRGRLVPELVAKGYTGKESGVAEKAHPEISIAMRL